MLSASSVLELVGAQDSVHPFTSRIISTGAEAAYFNPADLATLEDSFKIGFGMTIQNKSIKHGVRPDGHDVGSYLYDVGVGEMGAGIDGFYPPMATEELLNKRGSSDYDSFDGVIMLGAVKNIAKKSLEKIGGQLAVGVYALLPFSGIQTQEPFFNDSREQYFSNSLQFELYGDRLKQFSAAVALAGRFGRYFRIGAGLAISTYTKTQNRVFVPSPTDPAVQLINAKMNVGASVMPYFSFVVNPVAGWHLTGTFHFPTNTGVVKLNNEMQVLGWEYEEGSKKGYLRHVEGRIVAFDLRQGHGLAVPHGPDLIRITLLDPDVRPGRAGHINGGRRAQRIERDPVVLCQNRDPGGSDLVGKIPVRRNPVASHEAGLHPAVLHHQAGHVVADQRHVHPGPLQFIRGQARPLEQRTRFIREHPEVDSPFLPQEHRPDRGPVFRGGQRTGIAVGQDPVSRFDQGKPVFGDPGAHPDIFVVNGNALLQQQVPDRRNVPVAVSGYDGQHPLHRPAQVHRRGPGGNEISPRLLQRGGKGTEILFPFPKSQDVHPVCRADADRRCAPHRQRPDRLEDFLRRLQLKVFLPVGKLPLVQDHDAAPVLRQMHTAGHPVLRSNDHLFHLPADHVFFNYTPK